MFLSATYFEVCVSVLSHRRFGLIYNKTSAISDLLSSSFCNSSIHNQTSLYVSSHCCILNLPASCNLLRSDHSDESVVCHSRSMPDSTNMFLSLQVVSRLRKFYATSRENGTRLVARFDWDQRYVAEPPSYQRDLWSTGRFWSLQLQLLAPRSGPKSILV